MLEKKPYHPPHLKESKQLTFQNTKPGGRVSGAKTIEGKNIYRKQKRVDFQNVIDIEREKTILRRLRGAGLLVEVPFEGGDNRSMFVFDEGKEILKVLHTFDREKRKLIYYQLGQELAKIHNVGILHGDMSPRNIVCDSHGKVSFIDFEFAKYIDSREQHTHKTDQEYNEWCAEKMAKEVRQLAVVLSFEMNDGDVIQALLEAYLNEMHPVNEEIKQQLLKKIDLIKQQIKPKQT
ncbi:MAG: RIO1 family regulatory kinase/ATPase [Candidatus Magasanikbacteria bacterium]